MPHYKLIISYDGTRFHGFQRQIRNEQINIKKRPRYDDQGQRKAENFAVQECLEVAIAHFSGSTVDSIKLRFAGRTDKGVHARGQVIAVHLPDSIGTLLEIQKGINTRLPVDIAIKRVEPCSPDFHPRHDAKVKRYSYTIKYRKKVFDENGVLLPLCETGYHTFRDAFDSPCMWLCPWALDDTLFDTVSAKLTGEHDYSAFVHKEERAARSNVMSINRIWKEEVEQSNEDAPYVVVRFFFEATGFRRSMVRNLVGFIVDYCRGRDEICKLQFVDIWQAEDTVASKIHAAPASGLSLDLVKYE